MNIQIIGYELSGQSKNAFPGITISTLSAPKSLDEFDINVIDLTSESIWRYSGENATSISCINDFKSVQTMVEKKTVSKVVFQFPQNLKYLYAAKIGGNGYYRDKPLKDMLGILGGRILCEIVPERFSIPSLVFENTHTALNRIDYSADFYFDTKYSIITESVCSKKPTTIMLEAESIYATTLKVTNSKKELENFLHALFDEKKRSDAPEWVKDIAILDDDEQTNIIADRQKTISVAEQDIFRAREKLNENAEFKSILYTNGDELVTVVFKILEKILGCDLSGFIDEKREDFLIQKELFTFIGEIKGVTSNVKNEHISQVDVHYQGYMDKMAEEQREENVRQLLIINPFRTKPIDERESINQRQIDLAQRNKCLIIDTYTLLHVFEKFCRKEITVEDCTAVLGNCVGVLQMSDFEKLNTKDLEAYKV